MTVAPDPDLVRAHRLLASGRVADAAPILRTLAGRLPAEAIVWQLWGYATAQLNLKADAIPLLQRGIALGLADLRQRTGGAHATELAAVLGNLAQSERSLAWVLHEIGRSRDAEIHFARAHELQQRSLAATRDGPATGSVHLQSDLACHIGETGTQLDVYVKMARLGWLPPRRPVVATGGRIANRAFLDLWRPFVDLAPRNPNTPPPGEPFEILVPLVRDGRGYVSSATWSIVQQAWETEGRPPLLHLPSALVERGRAFLATTLGMKPDDWFVALHLRDSGFGAATGRDEARERHRNQSLEPTLAALSQVTDRGGWVIRLGDEHAPPLPPGRNLFDYAHFGSRRDWLDLFFCAAARVYWGTSSGPFSIAAAFGVPVIATNWIPVSMPPPSSVHCFLPKRLRSRRDSRFLTLTEMLADPVRHAQNSDLYEALGLDVVENDAAEIIGLVDAYFDGPPGDDSLQAAARDAYAASGLTLNARLSEHWKGRVA